MEQDSREEGAEYVVLLTTASVQTALLVDTQDPLANLG
jgi:hypothetical protein